MKGTLLQNMTRAYKGRRLWLQLIREYDVTSNKYVLLLPSENKRTNYIALSYLKSFMERKKAEGVVIVTSDGAVAEAAKLFYGGYLHVKGMNRGQMEDIMKFYCLYDFTDRLIIGSLNEPEGRVGEGIIGKKGITEEELFKVTIYGLDETASPNKPTYEGDDREVVDFIKIETV